jgi:hypothetical protein
MEVVRRFGGKFILKVDEYDKDLGRKNLGLFFDPENGGKFVITKRL